MQNEIENPIPTAVQDFYDLFKQDFSNVSFPDISLEILEKLISDVHEKMNSLQEAIALVNSAQQALESSQNELLQKSMRGLAYAKIYAEDQDDLLERLSRINLSKSNRAAKKVNSDPTETKRSRNKKAENPEETEITV